jgi:phosphoribosyl 1,2-cyclic phosphodiesterase
MKVRFWGTRGSIAVPGAGTLTFGGNTSCVEARATDGTLLILDCGTGARLLGLALLAEGHRAVRGHILLSHTHWDHIQGFPFFGPAFEAGNRFTIYAPQGGEKRLKEVLAGQMESPYFPVALEDMGANIAFRELAEGTFHINRVQVAAQHLNHPSATMGYRLTDDGVSIAYVTDHEPYAWQGAGDHAGAPADHPEEIRLREFVGGADLLIMDAMYTEEEYPSKVSWGHGTIDYCADVAVEAGVRRLALFHHDPNHDDATVEQLVEHCRQRVKQRMNGRTNLEVFAAAEGQELHLSRGGGA